MMNDATGEPSKPIGLDDAFALSSPADNEELYRRWASTYDGEFRQGAGYIYNETIAAAFAELADETSDPVIDVGCGTGAVGESLQTLELWTLDGVDLSTEMLAVARAKTTTDGRPLYRDLIRADLLAPDVPIEPGSYGAAVCAGLFTHGHVGPEALPTIAAMVRPGGLLCIGVNEQFFAAADFATSLDRASSSGLLTDVTVGEIPIYANDASHEHARTNAKLIVARLGSSQPSLNDA